MAASSFRDLLGVPAGTASTSDSALVIIDAQNEYASGTLAVTNASQSRKAITELLEKYRAANGKVIHVLHQTPDGAPIFTPGTELAKEFKELTAKVNSPCCSILMMLTSYRTGRRPSGSSSRDLSSRPTCTTLCNHGVPRRSS